MQGQPDWRERGCYKGSPFCLRHSRDFLPSRKGHEKANPFPYVLVALITGADHLPENHLLPLHGPPPYNCTEYPVQQLIFKIISHGSSMCGPKSNRCTHRQEWYADSDLVRLKIQMQAMVRRLLCPTIHSLLLQRRHDSADYAVRPIPHSCSARPSQDTLRTIADGTIVSDVLT